MNYKSLLAEIHNAAMASENNSGAIVVPSNKQLYNIDLNTRTIDAPAALSVQTEHYAETVYFLVDRYYDHMDLAQTNCVVQYVINNQPYIYVVPFCDITTYENKMIIPWSISISATRTSGTIEFLVRFFLIADKSLDGGENENAEFSYSLSTLTAKSKILKTLQQDQFVIEDQVLELPERYLELRDELSRQVDLATTYWIEV